MPFDRVLGPRWQFGRNAGCWFRVKVLGPCPGAMSGGHVRFDSQGADIVRKVPTGGIIPAGAPRGPASAGNDMRPPPRRHGRGIGCRPSGRRGHAEALPVLRLRQCHRQAKLGTSELRRLGAINPALSLSVQNWEDAMKLPRRRFLQLAAGGLMLPTASHTVRAQAYPSKPLRWLIGFPAGGGADTVARIMEPWLTRRLGQPVIIENRPGPRPTSRCRPSSTRRPTDTRCCGTASRRW